MKRGIIISAIAIFTFLFICVPVINAQERTKEEKERELRMQEAIIEKKKAMADKEAANKEAQKYLEQLFGKEQAEKMQEIMLEMKIKIEDPESFKDLNKFFGDWSRNRPVNAGDPFSMGPGHDFWRQYDANSQRTSWDFTKSVRENSFSREYIFDVDESVKNVTMAVFGDCNAGDIRIRIMMPGGKTYADIVIDEFGNLNWRKSFNISDTENQDKVGEWKFEIKASKATGYFRISLQAG
jgi:hypothetical protein